LDCYNWIASYFNIILFTDAVWMQRIERGIKFIRLDCSNSLILMIVFHLNDKISPISTRYFLNYLVIRPASHLKRLIVFRKTSTSFLKLASDVEQYSELMDIKEQNMKLACHIMVVLRYINNSTQK